MSYGTARSPQPTMAHTCQIRRRLQKGWTNTTSQDDCPACQVDRAEGWAQLLDSVRSQLVAHPWLSCCDQPGPLHADDCPACADDCQTRGPHRE